MKSLIHLYKIGHGPSSSHSMGPAYAAEEFRRRNPDADKVKVTLYGSLAKTGKGHHTDYAVLSALNGIESEVVFDMETTDIPHENTLDFTAYKNESVIAQTRFLSVGGGDIEIPGEPPVIPTDVYTHNTFSEIAEYCKSNAIRLSDYVYMHEGEAIKYHLAEVWQTMKDAISRGLKTSGVLEGGLGVERKAQFLFNQRHIDESQTTRENRLVCSYAFAVAEENADNGTVVTAPTCGACGVLPAALRYAQITKGFTDQQICRGLATAGIIGNITKRNASISGAQCGCQAEIGTACSMAAAALAELYGQELDQVEYAAEVAMEHHLGLTCDPVCGLVQIPCIERNAVAAMRAMNACNLSYFLTGSRNISYDMVCRAMKETGENLSHRFRETSEGGLAKLYDHKLSKFV